VVQILLHTSSSSSFVLLANDFRESVSLGTHCTWSNILPTSQGIAIAVLPYCRKADATIPFSITEAVMYPGSMSRDPVSSKIEFCGARTLHC
jgi:hypothetical protein